MKPGATGNSPLIGAQPALESRTPLERSARDERRPDRAPRRRGGAGLRVAICRLLQAAILVWLPTSAVVAASPPNVRHPGGFWKCRPPGVVKGEFDNEDPVGLAAHTHIATDCALHWSDGHGAIYCFATPPSFLEFESNPDLLSKARAFWRLEHPQR